MAKGINLPGTYYRVSMYHDASGRFHHFEIWLAYARCAFVLHKLNMLPGATFAEAHAIVAQLNAKL